MTDMHEQSPGSARSPRSPRSSEGPPDRPTDSKQYDLWYDGLLDDASARRERGRVAADPVERARFEADRAIEDSLRRSFGAALGARPLPLGRTLSLPTARAPVPWVRYGAAAGVLTLIGIALAISSRERDSAQRSPLRGPDGKSSLVANSLDPLADPAARLRPAPERRTVQASLGDVFLDALALDFQPLLGCRAQDPWDVELFAQLAEAPCNRVEEVVVLGEWIDPRLDVANVLMLRRGENPIMLVVPRCEQDMELCVPKDSGLYVHRGMRDGRAIYEISPVPGSEVLGCVAAHNVVTQQQF